MHIYNNVPDCNYFTCIYKLWSSMTEDVLIYLLLSRIERAF